MFFCSYKWRESEKKKNVESYLSDKVEKKNATKSGKRRERGRGTQNKRTDCHINNRWETPNVT